MSHQLTRQGAYFLRRSAHGREVVFQFLTRKELVVALAKQYKAVVGDDQRIKIFISSADSSCLSVFRTLSVQVSHSKFGAVRAVRTDLCIEFEAFGPTGKPLNIRGLLESSSLHESKSPRARRGGIYCGYWSMSTILTARRQLSWPVEAGKELNELLSCASLSPRRGMPRLGCTTAVALHIHLQNGRVVHKTVHCCQRHGRFHKHFTPLRERRVGRDCQALALIAFGYQFEQYRGLGLVPADITQVIQNKQVKPIQLGQFLRQP